MGFPSSLFVALSLLSAPLAAQTELQDLRSNLTGERLGSVVAAAGDVNGDGVVDWMVGSPDADSIPFIGTPGVGKARVVSGVDGSTIHAFTGASQDDALGSALAAAGDLDGDGYGDVVIGIPGYDRIGLFGPIPDAGRVEAYSGFDGSLLGAFTGSTTGESVGAALAGGQDVTGDGLPDVIAGAPMSSPTWPEEGEAIVLRYDGASLVQHVRLAGGETDGHFGSAVAILGDIDADGRAEFAVGGPDMYHLPSFSEEGGIVRVFDGFFGVQQWETGGPSPSSHAGTSVAAAGDHDGDGVPDLVFGAPSEPGLSGGWARVIAGDDQVVLATRTAHAPDSAFGISVGGGSDANADGLADIIVGEPYDSTPGSTARGQAHVYAFGVGRILILTGDAADSEFGLSVAALGGDVNGDGRGEYAVGAPSAGSLIAPSAGRAVLYSGSPTVRYGEGLGGANVATLDCSDNPYVGTTIQMDLEGPPQIGAGILAISITPTNLPLFGGTLLVDIVAPVLQTAFPVIDGQGSVPVALPPSPNFIGVDLYAQGAMPDATQPIGFAFSNGLHFTIGSTAGG